MTRSHRRRGEREMISAASALTIGAANDVPDHAAYVPFQKVLTMRTAGASTLTTLPKLENSALVLSAFSPATATTWEFAAGNCGVSVLPLPAEVTTTAPRSVASLLALA